MRRRGLSVGSLGRPTGLRRRGVGTGDVDMFATLGRLGEGCEFDAAADSRADCQFKQAVVMSHGDIHLQTQRGLFKKKTHRFCTHRLCETPLDELSMALHLLLPL